jgi:outer membrane protein TolC
MTDRLRPYLSIRNHTCQLRIATLLTVAAALPLQAVAQEEQPPLLPLQQVIQTAVQHNLSLRSSQLDPIDADARLRAENAAFDPELFASASTQQDSRGDADQRSLTVGSRWNATTGTSVTAAADLDRSEFSNSGIRALNRDADLRLTIRQALLRGRGSEVNRAAIEQAQAGVEIAAEALRDTVLAVLEETEIRYWRVAGWQEQRALVQSNLAVAEALLEEAIDRERVGVTTRLDVLQAEAAVAQRKEELINTERNLGDALDSLFASMGTLIDQQLPDLAPASSVAGLPQTVEELDDFADLWLQTIARDPQLSAQAAAIRQSEWRLRAAVDQTRPDLDLVVSGGLHGSDPARTSDALANAAEADDHSWGVALEFSVPWGRRAGRAAKTLAENQLERESLRYEALRQQRYGELRSRYRSLLAVRQSVDAADLNVRLQQAAFEQETGRYEQGIATFREVLQAQRDLDQARIRQIQIRLQQVETRIALERLSGTLLQRHGIPADTFSF